MLLADVNVLIYAFREDAVDHVAYRGWLERVVGDEAPFGVADLVLSSFVRLVTNPRIYLFPTPMEAALRFAESLRSHPGAVAVAPGSRHWSIFCQLCRPPGVRGNLVSDAYLAALAIESGCEWVTTDGDFARFPGLRWRHPLSA